MPGTPAGSSYAAVTALPVWVVGVLATSTTYAAMVFPWSAGRIGGMEFNLGTLGTGTGTVLDVFVNGASIWTTAADRPTIAVSTTGRFTQAPPNVKGLKYGDLIAIRTSATVGTSAAGLSGALALERA
jgi:hypothetical protein